MTKVAVKEGWFNTLRNQDGTREFASATAWVNFNGAATPITIRDSLNVSSITDNGTGDYTVNFEQAMDNANYAVAPGGSRTGLSDRRVLAIPSTVNSADIRAENQSATPFDIEFVNLTVFGGVA